MKAWIVLLLALPLFVAATDLDQITAGKALVDRKASCAQLTEGQLEQVGEYYMELRHPGPSHDWMDSMMGGEGSESLRLAHVRMAQVFYCGQGPSGTDRFWMMPLMGFRTDGNAWNYGNGWNSMMGNNGFGGYGGMMGYGWNGSVWSINGILFTLLLTGGTVAVFLFVLKTWKDIGAKPKGRNKS